NLAQVYLLLGSNKGNRLLNLIQSLLMINSIDKITIKKISSLYETEPYGVKGQTNFINQVVEIQTEFRPLELHEKLLSIEKAIGRSSKGDFQPREIDIDILFYNSEIINTQKLTIPHYDLHNRRFVLEPLNELNPDFIHPVFKKSVKELLSQLKENLIVKKLE
ncbi:MAG: 2-amino-4-hydroxy-6-hydroxymethyldihydropteridine diphosphokinase, partial [Ignavibacteria bacterium]